MVYNKKQTISKQHNLELLKSLIVMTSYDIDDEGFHLALHTLQKALNITQRSLNRYLHELIKYGWLEVTCNHFDPLRHSMRYKWLKVPVITGESINLLNKDYSNNDIDLYSSIDNSNNIDNQDLLLYPMWTATFNQTDMIKRLQFYVDANNARLPIKSTSTLRYGDWTTGKKKIRRHTGWRGRVMSVLCLTKSGKHDYKSQDYRLLRKDFFRIAGLPDYEEVYDIKSEVPRTTAFINGIHEWDEIDDYYSYFTDIAEVDFPRELAKELFMPCYFEPYSKTNALRCYLRRKLKTSYFDEFAMRELFTDDFNRYYDAVQTIKPIGNEIFYWTSLIEQAALYNSNDGTLNVYDGFYNNKDNGDYVKQIVKETAYKIKNG